MEHKNKLSLDCPYCKTKTQFNEYGGIRLCKSEDIHHQPFLCTNCDGIIMTKWNWDRYKQNIGNLNKYYEVVGDFKAQVDLQKIKSEFVRKDFKEAIGCYNNSFYNASMVLARRAIHQEIDERNIKKGNLYEKIYSLDISNNLKRLLDKVKNFGNMGAHPDFFLYDDKGEQLISQNNEKVFAKLSLVFLDKYFQDQYEMEDLITTAPRSDIEIKKEK